LFVSAGLQVTARELVREENLACHDGKATLTLDAEEVAVVGLP